MVGLKMIESISKREIIAQRVHVMERRREPLVHDLTDVDADTQERPSGHEAYIWMILSMTLESEIAKGRCPRGWGELCIYPDGTKPTAKDCIQCFKDIDEGD